VLHDATIDRTTHGDAIEAMRMEEWLDAGVKFGAQFAAERVPLLAEVFVSGGTWSA
jgi:hypothetical protein